MQPKCSQIPITTFLTFLLKNDNREGRKLFQVIQSFLYLSFLLFIQLFLHSAIKNLLSTFYLPDSILGAKNTKINLKNVITAQATSDLLYLKFHMFICLCPIILSAMHILFIYLCMYVFIYVCMYLFIYLCLCWVFISVRGLSLVVASGVHSSSWCAGLSLSRPLLLQSTGSRRAGSVVVAHGPSCSAACGIFPDQGSNPFPLHWQADSQPLCHQGSPTMHIFNETHTQHSLNSTRYHF